MYLKCFLPPSHLKVSCFQGTSCQPWWKGWWPSAAWEKDSGQGWFEWVWNSLCKIKSWKMSVLKRTVVWGIKIQTILWLQHHYITGEDSPPSNLYNTHITGEDPLPRIYTTPPHHWGRPPEYRKFLTLSKPKPTYSFVSCRPLTFDMRSLLLPRSHLKLLGLLRAPA